MPYARRRTYRRRRSRKRAPTSRKKMVALVKSVALSTQETKRHSMWWSPYGTLSPALQPTGNYAFCQNLWSDLPNIRNSLTDSSQSYVGDEIHLQGVKVRVELPQNFGSIDARISIYARMSIISWVGRIGAAGPVEPPVTWYKPDQMPLARVHLEHNPNEIKILWSRKRVFNGPTAATDAFMSHYHRFGRDFKRELPEESNVGPNYWGYNKLTNYYLLFEYHMADDSSVSTKGTIAVEKKVYFKDA